MSKGFSINDILGNTKANAPAGQKMQVVMLPAADIEPNPENSIYEIGDVSMLKADIAERGLRSPLEVLPAQNGKYMLLAGHRRWTACRALTAEGVAGFEVLPCVIRQSQGEDDDLIALITSNATARELTDGERLRQYRALKQALERKKAAGALDGRIRDEMSRITGDGTGTLGRLNAIANNCVPEVLAMVERGEITMTRAYECSRWSTPKTGTPVCRPSPIWPGGRPSSIWSSAAWPTSLRSSTMFARTNGTTLTAGWMPERWSR